VSLILVNSLWMRVTFVYFYHHEGREKHEYRILKYPSPFCS
jgi:hypothetical protein